MKDMQFTITNNDKKTTCHTIATYHDDNTGKDYIIYTDNTYNDNRKLNLYYGLYKIVDNNIKLINIDNLEDKKICLNIIESIVKEMHK